MVMGQRIRVLCCTGRRSKWEAPHSKWGARSESGFWVVHRIYEGNGDGIGDPAGPLMPWRAPKRTAHSRSRYGFLGWSGLAPGIVAERSDLPKRCEMS